MDHPIPFEQQDPAFGESIQRIVEGRSEIRSLQCGLHGKFFTMQDGSVRVKRTKENSPCPCGSGKKYKKCCGK